MSAAPVPRKIFTVAQGAELRPWAFSDDFVAAMPVFMRHDPPAALYYGRGHIDRCLDFVLAAAELATRSRGGAAPNSRTVAGMHGVPRSECQLNTRLRSSEQSHRIEQLATLAAQHHAQIPEILCRQPHQCLPIEFVFAARPLVPLQAKTAKPIPDVRRGSARRD